MKATRPLQYVCLFQADIPTKIDGDCYIYLAVDSFSKFVFNTGIERKCTPELILKHTALLVENEYFKPTLKQYKSFTLVYHKYSELTTAINQLIAPLNGKMLVSDKMVADVVMPTLVEMLQFFKQK